MSEAHHAPPGALSNRTSIFHLLSLLSSTLQPTASSPHIQKHFSPYPHSSPPSPPHSVVSRAFDLLLNPVLPYRYLTDDDDDNPASPLPQSCPHPSREEHVEAEEQAEAQAEQSQPPRSGLPRLHRVRVRDEWTSLLFLLRSHGHYDRANGLQLLADRLRQQRLVSLPSSVLSPSPATSPASAFVAVPFTSASAVLALLLELAGSAEEWNEIPPPLLRELQHAYKESSKASTFVLPPDDASLAAAALPSPLHSQLRSYEVDWTAEKVGRSHDDEGFLSSSLVEDAWLIDRRLSAPLADPLSPSQEPLRPLSFQPALFSFQKKESAPEGDGWLSVLPSQAEFQSLSPSSFVKSAVINAAADKRSHQVYGTKRKRQYRDAHPQAARFAGAWKAHRESLVRSASLGAPPHCEELVWQQLGAQVPPASPVADPLVTAVESWEEGSEAASFTPSSLSLFSHPQLFERLYASTLSSVFTPAPILSSPVQMEDGAVRCSLLALQGIPSALYSLSTSSLEMTVSTSSPTPFPPSAVGILNGCASTGTNLHRIERLARDLSAQGLIAQGLASSLLLFCSHVKQQIAALPQVALQRRQATSGPLSLTLLELHCHAESLQQHLQWLYDLLLRPYSSLAATSAVPLGAELLSFLYRHCLELSTDSPFFPTLTALFHSTLAPFLVLLHSFVYHGRVLDPHHELVTDASPPQSAETEATRLLRLPTFLADEEERVEQAGKLLRLLDESARPWAACCEDCGVPVLQVGYSIRDVDRMRGWRQELQTQQQDRLQELEGEETAKVQAAREALITKLRATVSRVSLRSEQEAEDDEAELREKRRRQEEYQEQLDLQLQEKVKRAEEERERELKEREKVEQQRLHERRIIEEEKSRLVALIQAARAGLDEQQMHRAEWRRRRMEHSDALGTLLRTEQAAWDDFLRQRSPANGVRPGDVPAVPDSSSEVEDGEEYSDADYHTDDEGDSPRPQSAAASAASRPTPLTSTRPRPFAFSYESPASPLSAAPSPHVFSPSPRHAATDTDDGEANTSAFLVPSPLAGRPSMDSAEETVEGKSGKAGGPRRRFMFDGVPSPKSGVDSGVQSSPATSPHHHRHSSAESVGSSSTSVASGSSTPSSRSSPLSTVPPPPAPQRPTAVTPAPSSEKAETETKAAPAEYNWEEPFDWAEAVTAEEAEEVRAAAAYGDDGEQGWTDDEEEERRQRAASVDGDSDASPSASPTPPPPQRLQQLQAETQRSRLQNRERNTVSAVTFASVEAGVEKEDKTGQSELIRLMAAKEALRSSNETRQAARERNASSRVFQGDNKERHVEGRRDEGQQLKANRQRMMASSVFPDQSDQSSAEQPRVSRPSSRASETPLHPQQSPSPPTAVADAEPAVVVPSSKVKEAPVVAALPLPPESAAAPPAVDEAVLAHRLPLDIAIRASLLPALRLQCAMVDRVALSFFVHSLRIHSHLQSLQHFFLMHSGDLLDTFTSALFASIKRLPSLPLTPPALLHHWQSAVELCPPSPSMLLHPSLISFSVSPSIPAPSLKRLAGMESIDCIRMRYDVPCPVNVVVTEEAVTLYGRLFNLLLRVLYTRHEMRHLFLWLRVQDAELRQRETQLRSVVRSRRLATTAPPSKQRRVRASAADDMGLLSPTKRRGVGSSPSSSAARDDDVYQTQRTAVAAARVELEGLVQARWRLRWLHAVRAEMEHSLCTVHHYLHISCIASQAARFDAQCHSPSVTSISHLIALHSSFLAGLTASTFLSSPSPVATLLEAVLSTVLTFAQSLSPFALLTAVDAEGWQGLKNVAWQFRQHGVFLSRVLKAVREESKGEEGIAAFEAAFDFNRFYSTLRQRELEATVLTRE